MGVSSIEGCGFGCSGTETSEQVSSPVLAVLVVGQHLCFVNQVRNIHV